MDTATIIAMVNLLATLVEKLTTSAQVDYVISLLEAWLPTILAEVQSLVPLVKGILSTLKGSSILTADQISTVDSLNTQVDSDFDAAAAAAQGSAA